MHVTEEASQAGFPTELSMMMEMFSVCVHYVHSPHMAMEPQNVASTTELLDFKLYLILMNLNEHLNSHMWLLYWTIQF